MMSSKKQPRVRESSCPSLPPEVWINVFTYHTDLAHLWNTCRRVSSVLRACVEYSFADYFIHDIQIDFQLEKHNLGGKSRRPEVPVTFERLGKGSDREIVWFSDKRHIDTVCDGSSKQAQEKFSKIMERWKENVNSWRPELPNFTVSIRGIVNDTALPGLEVDIDAREVRFEWRKMLQLFYREHERLHVLKDDWHATVARQIRANNARLAKGEKLMPSDYPQPWSTAEIELRKEIRRARLKESYCSDEQMLWAIGCLKHFEKYGAANGNAKALKLDPDLPGAGLGERWFGSANLVQELYLDEWSCIHRIDTKIDHMRTGL